MQAVVMMVIGLPLSLVAVEVSPNLWVCIAGVFASAGLGAVIASKLSPDSL